MCAIKRESVSLPPAFYCCTAEPRVTAIPVVCVEVVEPICARRARSAGRSVDVPPRQQRALYLIDQIRRVHSQPQRVRPVMQGDRAHLEGCALSACMTGLDADVEHLTAVAAPHQPGRDSREGAQLASAFWAGDVDGPVNPPRAHEMACSPLGGGWKAPVGGFMMYFIVILPNHEPKARREGLGWRPPTREYDDLRPGTGRRGSFCFASTGNLILHVVSEKGQATTGSSCTYVVFCSFPVSPRQEDGVVRATPQVAGRERALKDGGITFPCLGVGASRGVDLGLA